MRATVWENDPAVVSRAMQKLSCEAGNTQIARVLRLALAEKEPVSGLVYVGDHCEDDAGELRELAASLGARPVSVFVFHECADDDRRSLKAKPIFKRMAEASGGVYVEFKPDSGAVLRELLGNVGALAAAGPEGVKQVEPATTAEARELRSKLMLPAPKPGGEA